MGIYLYLTTITGLLCLPVPSSDSHVLLSIWKLHRRDAPQDTIAEAPCAWVSEWDINDTALLRPSFQDQQLRLSCKTDKYWYLHSGWKSTTIISMLILEYTKNSDPLAVRTHYLFAFSWPHQCIQNLTKDSGLTLSKGHILTASPLPFCLPWIMKGSKHFNPYPMMLSQNITHFSKSCSKCFCHKAMDCNASQRQWIAEGHFKL